MIDEQKLLQWIEDKKYVYGEGVEEETEEEQAKWEGIALILNALTRAVDLGNLDADEEE